MALSTAHMQREMLIMERLQRDTFVLRPELQMWLEELEGIKDRTLDRRNVGHNLQKLQHEGRCKCVLVSVPDVSISGRICTIEVVLLPSVDVGPDLLNKIHVHLKAFDMRCHSHSSSRSKKHREGIPTPNILKRISHETIKSAQAVDKPATMCSNGFIFAKMVRVHMLHQFLWSYVLGLMETHTDDQSKQTISNSEIVNTTAGKIFSLISAVQTMPLELFLQVIGSPKHIVGLTECCRHGTCVCDLPFEESEALLDSSASGRLSGLVDILRRLRLLRMVMLPQPAGSECRECCQATLGYVLEERSYIEEPSSDPSHSLNSNVFNLSPHTRHDFHFTMKESIDLYWQTLENFFHDAVLHVAKRAFPGSTVPELFAQRSWTSLRVMSVDQRTELLKRISISDKKGLSCKECIKIAQDLNPHLEQVLKVSYEENQMVHLQTMHKETVEELDPLYIHTDLGVQSSVKRKLYQSGSFVESSNLKIRKRQQCLELDATCHQLNVPQGEQEPEGLKEPAEDDETESETGFVNHIHVVRKLKSLKAKKFLWSDTLDRILVACYARERAKLGARYNRVYWNSVEGLPAQPIACKKRIAFLKMELKVRRALLKLCSLLAARYTRYRLSQSRKLRGKTVELLNKDHDWDDFADPSISAALDEVIRCKYSAQANLLEKNSVPCQVELATAKLPGFLISDLFDSNDDSNSDIYTLEDMSKANAPHFDSSCCTDAHAEAFSHQISQIIETTASNSPGNEQILPKSKVTNQSNCQSGRWHENLVHSRKQLKRPVVANDINCEGFVRNSIEVASAVELIKMVLLDSSVGSELSNVLMDTLRKFKESDVFMAFKFLKDNDFVAIGHNSRAFVLSPKFHRHASASRFPCSTSDESLRLQNWLIEHKTFLEQDWVTLYHEQQCGEIFHLFALVSSGELSLAPLMPKDGVEQNDAWGELSQMCRMERHNDLGEFHSLKASRALGNEERSFGLRRGRGFPGIEVCAHLQSFSFTEMEGRSCKEGNGLLPADVTSLDSYPHVDKAHMPADLSSVISSHCSLPSAIPHLLSGDPKLASSTLWEVVHEVYGSSEDDEVQAKLAQLSSLTLVYDAVLNAREEGMRMDEIENCISSNEVCTMDAADTCVDALQSFGLVRKVIAFDHVRVIARQYSEHLSLHFPLMDQNTNTMKTFVDEPQSLNCDLQVTAKACREVTSNICRKPASPSSSEATNSCGSGEMQYGVDSEISADGEIDLVPILPWLTADGKESASLKKSLTRKVLGIVMLNPGISEDDLVEQVDVLNPMSTRKLLQLLELDRHLSGRTQMEQSSASPPMLLCTFVSKKNEGRKPFLRKRYHANSTSTHLL